MQSQELYNAVKPRLLEIFRRPGPPDKNDYLKVLEKVNYVLMNEDSRIRPYDSEGRTGGLIYLNKDIPTIIVPDIHGRMDFFLNVLFIKTSEDETNLEKVASDKLQIICVGDGVHGERRAAKRWGEAYKEFESDYENHEKMDEEMKESFGVMEMIMEMKINFPSNFHFLKGNHENIKNEEGGGNYPFVKFSYEGPMVAYYVEKFYGKEFLEEYSRFEKNLPVFAVGRNFLVSHAEPWTFYSEEDIIEYRNNPDVIEGLTWTADDAANDGSVQQMIDHYFKTEEDRQKSYYFGGHRPVNNLYNARAEGKYIQIHNPGKFIIALIDQDNIDLNNHIIELDNKIDDLLT